MRHGNIDEISVSIGRLEGKVEEGFQGIHERLDKLNSRTIKNEESNSSNREKIGLIENKIGLLEDAFKSENGSRVKRESHEYGHDSHNNGSGILFKRLLKWVMGV